MEVDTLHQFLAIMCAACTHIHTYTYTHPNSQVHTYTHTTPICQENRIKNLKTGRETKCIQTAKENLALRFRTEGKGDH